MEPKMSRSWIAGIAVASCASLFAFAPFARQEAKPGAAPHAMGPTGWVVTFELSKWDTSKAADQQPGFPEHMAACQKLAKEGTLLIGGPFLDDKDPTKPAGAMMIVKAENAEAARKLVSNDTLITKDLMKIVSVRAFMAGAGAWVPSAGAPAGGSKQ
jgi:uncharacterized protein YciI